MSEEEKQAIEYIRNCLDDEYDFKNATRCNDIKYHNIVLNLIEKQQKEIEKLKSKKYILNAETNEIKEIPISDDYISKDKIREKIEELENTYDENNKNDYHNQFIVDCVAILEELLQSGQESDQEGGQEDE